MQELKVVTVAEAKAMKANIYSNPRLNAKEINDDRFIIIDTIKMCLPRCIGQWNGFKTREKAQSVVDRIMSDTKKKEEAYQEWLKETYKQDDDAIRTIMKKCGVEDPDALIGEWMDKDEYNDFYLNIHINYGEIALLGYEVTDMLTSAEDNGGSVELHAGLDISKVSAIDFLNTVNAIPSGNIIYLEYDTEEDRILVNP